MSIAQRYFGLSEEGVEDAIDDSQAIRDLVGMDLAREAAPDATTRRQLRRLREAHPLTERPLLPSFAAINVHLAVSGG